MQRDRMSRIGVILIVVGVGFVFLWSYSIGYTFSNWYSSSRISALMFAMLMAGPPAALTLAGFALYVVGRRSFWAVAHRPKRVLAVLGLVLMVAGGFLITGYWASSAYAATKLGSPYDRPLAYYLATTSPYFVLFALWILSGLLIFADAVEAIFDSRQARHST